MAAFRKGKKKPTKKRSGFKFDKGTVGEMTS